MIQQIKNAYFPWVRGLQILLDYLIDQEEDSLGGDLNFCFYYKNKTQMLKRFTHFVRKANESVAQLPHTSFHQMINQALIGIYLADEKVRHQKDVQEMGKHLIRLSGSSAFFFFLNGLLMARLR